MAIQKVIVVTDSGKMFEGGMEAIDKCQAYELDIALRDLRKQLNSIGYQEIND